MWTYSHYPPKSACHVLTTRITTTALEASQRATSFSSRPRRSSSRSPMRRRNITTDPIARPETVPRTFTAASSTDPFAPMRHPSRWALAPVEAPRRMESSDPNRRHLAARPEDRRSSRYDRLPRRTHRVMSAWSCNSFPRSADLRCARLGLLDVDEWARRSRCACRVTITSSLPRHIDALATPRAPAIRSAPGCVWTGAVSWKLIPGGGNGAGGARPTRTCTQSLSHFPECGHFRANTRYEAGGRSTD